MSMSKEQERRLMGLLGKLAARDAGESIPNTGGLLSRIPELNGQEHTDAKTLVYMGWIRSRRGYMDVANSWSAEGIYAFDLTEDGRATLEAWNSSAEAGTGVGNNGPQRQPQPWIMVVHGSQEGNVPQVVNDIRLWCYDQGLPAHKAADLPNAGRFVNDKVNNAIAEADYYIVVLTADEELTNGVFRARPNTMIEMARVLDRNTKSVCVLKEDKVDVPSDYRGLVTEPLDKWQSVLQRELREAGLL